MKTRESRNSPDCVRPAAGAAVRICGGDRKSEDAGQHADRRHLGHRRIQFFNRLLA